jgi:hypothetical protein
MNQEQLQWLTAAVDRALTPAEERYLATLLQESEEARELLNRLQRDSDALLQLPRQTLPGDFSQRVLEQIRQRRLSPSRPVKGIRRRWLVAVAAMIVLSVGLASYVLLHTLLPFKHPVAVVKKPDPNGGTIAPPVEPLHPSVPSIPKSANALSSDQQRAVEQWRVLLPRPGELREYARAWNALVQAAEAMPDRARSEQVRRTLAQFRYLLPSAEEAMAWRDLWEIVAASAGQSLATVFQHGGTEMALVMGVLSEDPGAREVPFSRPSILTMRADRQNPFKTIELKLPLLMDLRKFDADRVRTRLEQGKAHYLDLACVETWKSFERFQAACKASRIRLVVDAEIAYRQKLNRPTLLMIYLENVSPDQLLRLLGELHKPDSSFDSLMIQVLDEEGRRSLADSLGMPQKTLEKPATEQGSSNPTAEPSAVALVYYPNRSRLPVSREVQQVLDARKGWQADALQIVFLLRPHR